MSGPTTMQWLRAAAGRVTVGSQRLVVHGIGRCFNAVRARVARWAWRVQLAVLLLVLYRGPAVAAHLGDAIHRRVASGAWGRALFITAGLWLLVAHRAGRDGWEPKQHPEPAGGAAGQEQAAVQDAAGSSLVSPVALVAAVRDIGTPHAQLKPLAEHLGTTTDAVRAAAQRMAWAVKDVRMQGRSASAGLRWDECPSPAEAYPSPGVVGAGQPATDDDDTRIVEIGGGAGLIAYPPETKTKYHRVTKP